ncbi:MAG: endolytic transglycosylase MltG [Chitinispirillaceae bacterium]|nr:endolytic transglycosylase MltG [Chitinispirillaceae bacterium]
MFLWLIRFFQKNITKLLVGIFLFIILVCGVGLFFYSYFLSPYKNKGESKSVEFIIEDSTTLRKISLNLKKEDVVRSSSLLLLWMRLKKIDRKIQKGIVSFEKGDGIILASKKLLKAKPIEIVVTVPEGLTIEQTATQIRSKFDIDTAIFIKLCYDTIVVKKFNILANSLEGYLFPDTYRLPKKVTELDIIRKMVKRHFEVWSEIQIEPEIAQKFTHHQLVILASIIEKEATVAAEQPRISGVFHNRLRLNYPLGADPTVRYLLRKFNGPLYVSELNHPSPYNTRRYTGLPPGPICSPGRGALAAAAFPMKTKELYFVAKWDGSGEHDFSETNAEHERKKILIRQKNAERLKKKKLNN